MPKRPNVSQSFNVVRLNSTVYETELGSLGIVASVQKTGGDAVYTSPNKDGDEFFIGETPIEEWAMVTWIGTCVTSGPINMRHLDDLGEGYINITKFRDALEERVRRDTVQEMLGDLNPILNKFKSSFNHEYFHDFLYKWTKALIGKDDEDS